MHDGECHVILWLTQNSSLEWTTWRWTGSMEHERRGTTAHAHLPVISFRWALFEGEGHLKEFRHFDCEAENEK